jgi:hypothetical protein
MKSPFQGPKHERSKVVKDIEDMLTFDSYSVYVSLSTVDDWNERHCRKDSRCPNAMLKQDELAFSEFVDQDEEQLRGEME